MARLLPHHRILEVGTGTGMLAALLSRTNHITVSLDNQASVLNTAMILFRSVGARVSLVQGNAFNLPFRDGVFDAAFSQGLLEHFSDADMVSLVREQARVAHHVYVSVPSFFYPHLGSLGPGLIGNERLLTLSRYQKILGQFNIRANYYSDFKLATFAGWSLPWPNQLLMEVLLTD